MLKRLEIKNYILIDNLEIDFSEGLSVITGETGAGKSIILFALGLIVGGRADQSLIRPGAEKCIIEAEFIDYPKGIDFLLEEEDIDLSDSLIIRREVSSKGKSRAFVNDTPTTLALLKALGEQLIDIHSQHKNLLLGDLGFQLSVLDGYHGDKALLKDYQEQYKRYRALQQEVEQLKERLQRSAQEESYIAFQLEQLEGAHLEEGEDLRLEEEYHKLSHQEELSQALRRAVGLLDDDDYGVLSRAREAGHTLESVAQYLPSLGGYAERIESALIELRDLNMALEDELEELSLDPQRLVEVEERLNQLNSLKTRYNALDVAELLGQLEQLRGEHSQLEQLEDLLGEAERNRDKSQEELLKLGEQLSLKRKEAAREVEGAIAVMLQGLGMPYVRLRYELKTLSKPSAMGLEEAKILFSANKEQPLEAVEEIASGGEISRLMLSVKALMAGRLSLPTIIFDEIDTGVSGETAEKIARLLQEMGRSIQVIAVTHLPQIAASGRQHYYVYKEHLAEKSYTGMRLLSEEERIEEIARMQSGEELSAVALAAAKALLEKLQQPEKKAKKK